MRTFLSIFLVGALAGTVTVALAKKTSPVESHPSGMSAGHMADKGVANTNGPMSADRERGHDRAMDRRSYSGLEHSNAFEAHDGKNGYARKTGNRNR